MEKKYLNVVCAVIHDGDSFYAPNGYVKGLNILLSIGSSQAVK